MTVGPPTPGQITIELHGDARIVSFHGEHDASTATVAWERLSDARVCAGAIIVDLTAASFIDSSIVSTIFNAYQADTPRRLRVVVPVGTEPYRLLTLLRLDTVLSLFERLEDALPYAGEVANGERELCAFPACGQTVPVADWTDMALCPDHRQMLLDDPGEFRRLWGALDPRPPAPPRHIPGRPQGPIPPARGADH